MQAMVQMQEQGGEWTDDPDEVEEVAEPEPLDERELFEADMPMEVKR